MLEKPVKVRSFFQTESSADQTQPKGKNMSTTHVQPRPRKLPYWFNVLVAVDQLGNAIADGNPDNTISARVGYFASAGCKCRLKPYWKTLERIIDATFEPVQGPGHCYNAWLAEADEADTQGSYIARVILGVFVAAGCLVISLFLRLALLIRPDWRYKPGVLRYPFWRQSRKFAAGRHAAQVEP